MPKVARTTAKLPPERMTPIRIRGKQGQKARRQALKERAQRAVSEELELSSVPALSKIECLPTEILERIFLLSQDVSLPQASPVLGKVLSSDHVKHHLLRSLLTYGTSSGKGQVLFELDQLEPDRPSLQTKLLRCQWVDLPSIKRAITDLITSLLAVSLGHPITDIGDFAWIWEHLPMTTIGYGCPFQDDSISTLLQWGEEIYTNYCTPSSWISGLDNLSWPSSNVGPGDAPGAKLRSETNIISDSSAVARPNASSTATIEITDRPMTFKVWLSNGLNSYLQVFLKSGCEIPTKLLHGPWTASKKEFLEFMMRAGAMLDPVNSNNEEIADQSLREAIIAGDADVVQLLLSVWKHSSIHDLTCRLPLSLDHVRLAIFQGGCKRDIMYPILGRALEEHLDLDQEDILEWVNERKAPGDDQGIRLLHNVYAFLSREKN